MTSLHFCKKVTDVTSVTHCPISQAHKNWIPATTAVSESMFSSFSFLLLCMDVERNPGPQQQINISDLPVSSKALFNSARRTRLKITRYQSHLYNLLTYKINNMIPKGLTPKCHPAIRSNNPLFWQRRNENLKNLAKSQLDLLLEETKNNVALLNSTFSAQKEELRQSLNDDLTYFRLCKHLENMAFNLLTNLNQRRSKKLQNLLRSNHTAPLLHQSQVDTGSSSGNTNHQQLRRKKRRARSSQLRRKNRRTRSELQNSSNLTLDDPVIDLSNVQLSPAEMKLLSRGLTFAPTPQSINWSVVQADINDFARRLRLKEFFHNEDDITTDTDTHPFRCKGSWTPPHGREAALEAFINAVEQDLMFSKPARIRDNLTKLERKAIKQQRNRTDIVIKPADKGSGTVIMDYNWYVNECLRQLNDAKFYKLQSKDLTNEIQKRLKEYVNRLYKEDLIDEPTFKYLSSNSDPQAGRFYILPKIRKQGNPGRPIISSNGHPTERISQFVDFHLKPLVQMLPSYIKDTTHFLLQLQNLGPLPDNAILVTLDISSLYTNIRPTMKE